MTTQIHTDDHGRKHRVCGPAVVYPRETPPRLHQIFPYDEWWVHGEQVYSHKHFLELLTPEEREEALLATLANPDFSADSKMWYDEAYDFDDYTYDAEQWEGIWQHEEDSDYDRNRK